MKGGGINISNFENRSRFKHKISIPVLADISNIKPEKLRKIYHQIIEYDCIPLSEIPLIHQERYINDYYLQAQTLDLDLMKIAGHPDFGTDFPFLFSREVQQFFKTTTMIREANRISDSYASCKTVTSKLEELAAKYGISYRTLIRRRNYFMNQNILLKLLEDPSDHEDNKDRYPDYHDIVIVRIMAKITVQRSFRDFPILKKNLYILTKLLEKVGFWNGWVSGPSGHFRTGAAARP